MKAAKIINRPGAGQLLLRLLASCDHHIPFSALCRGGMIDKVAIHPLNGVADPGRDLGRREGQITYLDLHSLSGQRPSGAGHVQGQGEHTEDSTAHLTFSYLRPDAIVSACSSWPLKILTPVCSRLF